MEQQDSLPHNIRTFVPILTQEMQVYFLYYCFKFYFKLRSFSSDLLLSGFFTKIITHFVSSTYLSQVLPISFLTSLFE
jgi:hypothetical protein